MKISLFDKDDLRELEDMLVRALVRTARVVAREGLVQGWKPPVEAAPPPREEPAAVVAKAPEPPRAVPPAVPEKKQRAPRRSVVKIVKTVAERPAGYITTDQARDVIGRDNSSATALSRWVMEKEVPAVIVASHKPPTKGLPGRLMVDKQALIARNELRKKNLATLPALARWKEREAA